MRHRRPLFIVVVLCCGLHHGSAFAYGVRSRHTFVLPRQVQTFGAAIKGAVEGAFLPRLEELSWESRIDAPERALGAIVGRLQREDLSGYGWTSATAKGADIGVVVHNGVAHRLLIQSTTLPQWLSRAHGNPELVGFAGNLRAIADEMVNRRRLERSHLDQQWLGENGPALRISGGYVGPQPGEGGWFDMIETPVEGYRLIINAENKGVRASALAIGEHDDATRARTEQALADLARRGVLRP